MDATRIDITYISGKDVSHHTWYHLGRNIAYTSVRIETSKGHALKKWLDYGKKPRKPQIWSNRRGPRDPYPYC